MKSEILPPFFAALFYGFWAAYSNLEHGADTAVVAGLVQGLFAFFCTWVLTCAVHYLVLRQSRPRRVKIFCQCAGLLFVIPFGMHFILATPDILEAMLPGLLIGNGYVYLLLRRLIPTTAPR